MAKSNERTGSGNKLFATIIAIVMVVIIGICVWAMYSTISTKVINSQIESGEREATLEYMAKGAGLSVDEFIEQYGLQDAGLSKNSSQTEVVDKMTLENYAALAQTTVEDILKQYYLEGKADGSTVYADFKAMWTVRAMVQDSEENLETVKEYYGLDDSVTMDTLWSEVEPIIEAKVEEMQNATPAPAQETEQTEAE